MMYKETKHFSFFIIFVHGLKFKFVFSKVLNKEAKNEINCIEKKNF